MTLEELAALQCATASSMDEIASEANARSTDQMFAEMDAEECWKEHTRTQELLAMPGNMERILNCPLLSNASALPAQAPLPDRIQHCRKLSEVVLEFLSSADPWEGFYQSNAQRLNDLWEEPKRWRLKIAQQRHAAALAEESEQAQLRAELAYHREAARERFRKPQREAPCLAARRKNGLRCNRNTLILLAKQTLASTPEKEVEIRAHRCSECWQLYKEICERDIATKHLRDCFLMPGEADAVLALSFSPEEVEQYGKVDFAGIVCPILKGDEGKNAAD